MKGNVLYHNMSFARTLKLVFLVIILFFLSQTHTAYAGIFDGSSSGGGIFGNISDTIQGIFQGRDVEIGGSNVPFTPENPVPPDPDDPPPPAPGAGQFLRVWVEWETMYRGEQPEEIEQADPLEDLHIEYLEDNACCPSCGEVVSDIRPALWGWCGGTAETSEDVPVSLTSPGPNDNILPGAVPNKMIRRDGYLYNCSKIACEIDPGNPSAPIPTPPTYANLSENKYFEFQTLIYHSNDIEIDLFLQNLGNTAIEEIRIHRTSKNGKEWPHNIALFGDTLPGITDAGYIPMTAHHGDTYEATNQKGPSILLPNEISHIHQHHDKYGNARDSIPSVPNRSFPKVGYISPRDYNFICEPGHGEDDRCGLPKLVVERPLTLEEKTKYFYEYRDVSDVGGCGYNASSNNSIIGPIQYEVLYGDPETPERTARSIAQISIPVGNPLDDNALPIGWPATGRVTENWGNTAQANESEEFGNNRSLSDGNRREYDEYLYCPDVNLTYPLDGRIAAGDWLHPGIDIEPAFTQVRPANVYTTHAGWVTFAGYDPSNFPDKGYVVQVESDLNKDQIPDVITRYSHLKQGSIQINAQYGIDGDPNESTFDLNDEPKQFASTDSVYISRNELIGKMGTSGARGITQVQYEILYETADTETEGRPLPINGYIGGERCTDNPYFEACFPLENHINSLFFNELRFEPNLVFGPIFVNPT